MRHLHTSILSPLASRCTPLLLIPSLLLLPACSESESEAPQEVAELPAGPLNDPFGRTTVTADAPDATINTPAPGGGTLLVSEGIALTIPPGWIQEDPSSTMRAAQFRIPSPSDAPNAEMAVFRIRGGDVEDNFTRWIGQFSDMTAEPVRDQRSAGKLAVNWITLRGTYTVSPMAGGTGEPLPDSLFLGIIVSGEAIPMQIRISGPAQTLDHHSKAIDDLIQSIQPAP